MQSPSSAALTDAQIDRLEELLDSFDDAMTLEELDGYFCSLVSGPDTVMPSEYLPSVFGGTTPEFSSAEQASEVMGLLLQHWNHIAATLLRDDVYFPILFEDEEGKCQANDWAHGYMAGVQLRGESWFRLLNDDENGGLMVPVMALHFEHDADPENRPGPIDDEKREELVAHLTAAILGIYRYFAPMRLQGDQQSIRRGQPKIGRNDPCFCGSGKKYKHCHGAVTLHQ
jgi:uncharacterized protein